MAKRTKKNTRQRMINLMYLVFIAMLAINISEEVLDGFDLINENLNRTLENTDKRKNKIYDEINDSYKISPDKTVKVYAEANRIKQKSDSLFNYLQDLKLRIAKATDGKSADVNDIRKKGDLGASSAVMLDPLNKEASKLKQAIVNYRDEIVSLIGDPMQQELVRNSLVTEATKKGLLNQKQWEESSFESMPTIATITYLTELQANVRQAEGEVLNTIVKELDISDLRVNKLEAFVVPQSNIVMQGSNYNARILLAAVDSTQRPKIVVNGKELTESAEGKFSGGATSVGRHSIEGFISLMSRDGQEVKKAFKEEYTVIAPMVIVEPMLMDVLYAKYPNPLRVSVPGVVSQDIRVSATGGRLEAKGTDWIATPNQAGQDMTIQVSVIQNGQTKSLPPRKFRVRALPAPSAYIEYVDADGSPKMFRTGAISRASLLSAGGIKAAIDDGVLNVPFTVLGFRTMTVDAMGNASPEITTGGNFSPRQQEQMKKIQRGRTFIIASIRVQGPDGSQHEIYPMELRIN